jgi:hypothetical protein
MKPVASLLINLAAGLLAGVGGAYLMGLSRASSPDTPAATKPAPMVSALTSPFPPNGLVPITPTTIVSTEIGRLDGGNGSIGQGSAAIDFDEMRRMAMQHFDAVRLAHQRESKDPIWSAAASRSFERDFLSLVDGGGYQFVDVDCRMTTCAVTLRWPTYLAAKTEYRALVTANYEMNCRREMYIPAPDDFDRPYQATAYFDCESLRSGE